MENVPYLLAALACPVGMWLTMRGQHGRHGAQGQALSAPAPDGPEDGARLDGLRARLGELEAQQAAISGEIERLAGGQRPRRGRAGARPLVPPHARADARRRIAGIATT